LERPTAVVIESDVTGAHVAPLEPDAESAKRLARACNQLALDLHRRIGEGGGNLFWSPHSVFCALTIVHQGAGGQTRRQIAEVLHLPDALDQLHPFLAGRNRHSAGEMGEDEAELESATALWVDRSASLSTEFLDLVTRHHDLDVENVDFSDAAEPRINRWAEGKSHGKIRQLLTPGSLSPVDTRLVITNVLYFLGIWESKFKVENTETQPFWVDEDTRVDVPMMFQEGEFRYGESDSVKLIELPYRGGEFSMLVLLPDGNRDVEELEASLSLEHLETWTERLEAHEVELFLPRMKLELDLRLKECLREIGMPDAFSSVYADFSPMTREGAEALRISDVIHKTYLDVNEEGVEAVAATAVEFDKLCCGPSAKVFRADRPFLLMIRETRNNAILFAGKVLNPLPKKS